MQDNQDDNPARLATRPRLARTRFVGLNPARQASGEQTTTDKLNIDQAGKKASETSRITQKQTAFPLPGESQVRDIPLKDKSTFHLMQLSGMMRPLRKPGTTLPLSLQQEEDGYWPLGIQQIGPLPIASIYGREPLGRTLPTAVPLVMPASTQQTTEQKQSLWQHFFFSSACKIVLGLLSGAGLLLLLWPFINLPQVFQIIRRQLDIAPGILAGITFLAAHTLRGARWKVFLGSRSRLSLWEVIRLSQIATFLNVLLPLNAGEAAKSLILKRLTNVPFSQSLPTIATDKVLDLVAMLLISSLVPLLGIAMSPLLWFLSSIASVLLLMLISLTCLTAWRRAFAFSLLPKIFAPFPRNVSHRIESFITGTIDALLIGFTQPTLFLSALLLTGLAVVCNGLCILLAGQTIGLTISLSSALLGYAIYTLCYAILPTPPGQLGSNEIVGLLIFGGLLHLPGNDVIAMVIFSHIWTVLIISSTGLMSLKSFGLTIASALHIPGPK